MESTKTYTKLLCSKLCPVMVDIFVEMYKEAITRSGGRRDHTIKIFNVLLEEVENWNNTIIAKHATVITSKCGYFSDLLAAVFICYVNNLAKPIRKKSHAGKELSVQLPTNSDFIHRCLSIAADLFQKRIPVFREENETVRYDKMYDVCAIAVEQTLDELLPIQHILRTYIDSSSVFNMDEDQAEPEPEEPEPETEEAPEVPEVPEAPAPEAPAPALAAPAPALAAPVPALADTKQIPVRPEHMQPSLFDDAPDSRDKTIGTH